MSEQVIYSMMKVGKVYPPNNKQVLRDISLSFYYGAKIGVLGLNGSGKSTLLRIMAGMDPEHLGETAASKAIPVGLPSKGRISTPPRPARRRWKRGPS